MTVHYCDHCGKKIWRIVTKSSISCQNTEDDEAAYVTGDETMMIHSDFLLCKPCYDKYWEERKKFDIDFFSEAVKEKNNGND